MFARIKAHAIVWVNGLPYDWVVRAFAGHWHLLEAEQKEEVRKEFAAQIFEVERYNKNRKCILVGNGFGSCVDYGRGPIKVNCGDLVVLDRELAVNE